MKSEVDNAIAALTELKPFVADLADIKAKVASARIDLDSVNSQLEKVRETVKNERNARVLELNDWKKKHDAEVMSKQGELEFVQLDIEKAKEELRSVQNDITKWQKKFDELAGKTNKLEKILG